MSTTPDQSAITNRYSGMTPGKLFRTGVDEDRTQPTDNRVQAMFRDSSLAVTDRNYRQVFSDPTITPAGRAAYVAGRVVHDVVNDGTRVPWWVLNHPMAQTSVASDMVATKTGLAPDYGSTDYEGLTNREDIDEAFAKKQGFSYRGEGDGVPLGLARKLPAVLATAAMLASSGNSDFLNIPGGGRIEGFEAVMPTEGDKTQSENPLLELGARYLFGRTGRVLPWDEFTAERPDVSPTDFGNYRAYQFDSGPFLGLIKGTTRNIDAEPEMTMTGFRVPLSAAASVAGALGGVFAGASVADNFVSDAAKKRVQEQGINAEPIKPGRGHHRLAGAAIGGLLGSILGREGSRAVNATILQPMLNPEAVAAAQLWQQEQQAAGLL